MSFSIRKCARSGPSVRNTESIDSSHSRVSAGSPSFGGVTSFIGVIVVPKAPADAVLRSRQRSGPAFTHGQATMRLPEFTLTDLRRSRTLPSQRRVKTLDALVVLMPPSDAAFLR